MICQGNFLGNQITTNCFMKELELQQYLLSESPHKMLGVDFDVWESDGLVLLQIDKRINKIHYDWKY